VLGGGIAASLHFSRDGPKEKQGENEERGQRTWNKEGGNSGVDENRELLNESQEAAQRKQGGNTVGGLPLKVGAKGEQQERLGSGIGREKRLEILENKPKKNHHNDYWVGRKLATCANWELEPR